MGPITLLVLSGTVFLANGQVETEQTAELKNQEAKCKK